MRILMVCLGNICRSPLAEGILKAKAIKLGLPIEVDSAGTGGWHAGELPDHRSRKIAEKHGIDITYQRARKFQLSDFQKFEFILAMDNSNLEDLLALTQNENERIKVKLLLDYLFPGKQKNVPDPYYGDIHAFEEVYQLLDQALDSFLSKEFPSISLTN
ncbi:MAG: low molecular weight phosphotyrosine protein phosphatase [Bacteroidia bacterium]|nr:low molecular weight phosphotyrosine protein phosphatase [Bacteroidia bacterium]